MSKITINHGVFSFADLCNTDLRGLILSGCTMQATNFTGSNLRTASFFDCCLKKANFKGCDLRDTTFQRCNLDGAIFVDAKMDKVDLKYCDISKAVFQNPITPTHFSDLIRDKEDLEDDDPIPDEEEE